MKLWQIGRQKAVHILTLHTQCCVFGFALSEYVRTIAKYSRIHVPQETSLTFSIVTKVKL